MNCRIFVARLKQANLVSKTYFDNKLISFNRKITSNKTKYLKVQKNPNSLATKGYNFFLGRMSVTGNAGSQNTFVCQTTLSTLELKLLIMFLAGNQKEYIILNLSYYRLLSYVV